MHVTASSVAAIGLLCALVARADLLIENVTIVSPEQVKAAASQHVLVRGERIVAISAKLMASTAISLLG